HQFRDFGFAENNRQQTVLHAVVRKDVSERRRNNCAKSKISERPRRMFTRRTTAEILSGDQNRCAATACCIQRKRWIKLAVSRKPPIIKKKFTKAGALDSFEKLFRNNLIRIDVGSIENGDKAGMYSKGLHANMVYR